MGGSSPFVIKANETQCLCKEACLSEMQYLATLVKPTQLLSRVPISRFCVRVVGLRASRCIFKGVNLEFEGLPLNHSVHAEQFLVANAAQQGEAQLRFIAVSTAPCGHCRQFQQEVWGVPEINILIVDEHAETRSLLYFLPHRFGPDVLEESTPPVFQTHFNGLGFRSMNSPELNSKCNDDVKEDPLRLQIDDGYVKEEDIQRNFLKKNSTEMLSDKILFLVFPDLCNGKKNFREISQKNTVHKFFLTK